MIFFGNLIIWQSFSLSRCLNSYAELDVVSSWSQKHNLESVVNQYNAAYAFRPYLDYVL